MQERLDTTRDAEGPVLDMRAARSARERAIDLLMRELEDGERSIRCEADLIPEEDVCKMFGVVL